MIRNPTPVVVAYDLQAALIRCGIKVEDKQFAYAAALAMSNLARAWLYGARQIVSAAEAGREHVSTSGAETASHHLSAIMSLFHDRLEALTAAHYDTHPWRGMVDRQIIEAVAAVGAEGRDFCPRFGWGLNFPPPAEQVEKGAVSLGPPCALADRGCHNALLPDTGYAAVEAFPNAGWRPAKAGHGLNADAKLAMSCAADGAPLSDAAKAADMASAIDPLPSGDGPRNVVRIVGDSDPSKVEGLMT